MNNKKISTRQMIFTLTIFSLTMTISYMPSLNLPPGNQDIWLVVLLSIFYSIVMRIPLLYLGNRFNNYTIIGYLRKILGKFLGTVIGVLYGLYFAAYGIYLIILQMQLVGSDILPETSNEIMMLILIIVSIYAGLKGLLVIIRSCELIGPITIVGILALIVLGVKGTDFRVFLPILADSKFSEINIGAITLALTLTDSVVLAMSISHLEKKQDVNKIFIKSSIYSMVLGVLAVIVTQGQLGIEQAKHANYPFVIYTRLISYSDVVERIDPLYVILWVTANAFRISMYIYISSMAFKEILGKKAPKTLVYIIGIIAGIIALNIANSKVIILEKEINTLIIISVTLFTLIIPCFVSIIYFFRRKSLDGIKGES